LSIVTRRVIPEGREALLTSGNPDIYWGGRGRGETRAGSPAGGRPPAAGHVKPAEDSKHRAG